MVDYYVTQAPTWGGTDCIGYHQAGANWDTRRTDRHQNYASKFGHAITRYRKTIISAQPKSVSQAIFFSFKKIMMGIARPSEPKSQRGGGFSPPPYIGRSVISNRWGRQIMPTTSLLIPILFLDLPTALNRTSVPIVQEGPEGNGGRR